MSEHRTAVLIVLDGLGDRLAKELGNRTPLQAAKTPNLDRLAKEGQSGLMDVLAPGLTPGSDTAHLTLFGYDYTKVYPGRGPLEALGAGLPSKPGDVAFRLNFATVDKDGVVVDRRAGRVFTSEEHRALEKALAGIEVDDIKVHVVATVEHRGALVLEGKGLSGDITDNDPHETGKKPLEIKPLSDDARRTADIANKVVKIAHDRLHDIEVNKQREKNGLPQANMILLRGAGKHADIQPLKERFGISSMCLAGGALYIGCAKYVGMDYIPVEGQTGTIDTNFHNIGSKAIECIKDDINYLFVHIKATDNAGHDGNAAEKTLAIERTDEMVGRIVQEVGDRIVLAVTGDHTTSVTVGEHSCDPVPLLLWSKFIRPDIVERYSEIDAARGALNGFRGSDVMHLLLGYAGYIEKVGA